MLSLLKSTIFLKVLEIQVFGVNMVLSSLFSGAKTLKNKLKKKFLFKQSKSFSSNNKGLTLLNTTLESLKNYRSQKTNQSKRF